MTNLVSAYQKKEINEFEHILKGKEITYHRIYQVNNIYLIYHMCFSQSKINYGRSFYSNIY